MMTEQQRAVLLVFIQELRERSAWIVGKDASNLADAIEAALAHLDAIATAASRVLNDLPHISDYSMRKLREAVPVNEKEAATEAE